MVKNMKSDEWLSGYIKILKKAYAEQEFYGSALTETKKELKSYILNKHPLITDGGLEFDESDNHFERPSV
jgi:hypothetical protein